MSNKTKLSQGQNLRARNATLLSRKLLCGASFIAGIVALGAAPAAHAADRHWDANRTSVGSGGTGTWDLNDLNWSPSADGVSGPYNLPWDNTALDNAIFAGTAGTVTLGAPVTVNNLTFNSANYLLTGGIVTLAGASPTITINSGNSTIDSVIAGSSGLTKAGAGGLLLNGVNTFAGDIYLNSGSLYAGSDAALGAAGNNIFTAAGVQVRLAIGGTPSSRAVTIGNNGSLILEGTGSGSTLISGNGTVRVAASGITMSNDASTYTGQTVFSGCNGTCSARFTSVRNLGEASSLGAPVTVADGTIVFNQTSQYSDTLFYLGDGDSSNRNWDINGNAAIIRNQGTGTLTLTGNVDISAGGTFMADTADVELLGLLSGGEYGFNGAAGHVVRLGGANTFVGQATLSGLVEASVLANTGVASSLGAGTTIGLSIGTLSYVGSGSSSDRLWLAHGANNLSNNGTGALNLSGAMSFIAGGIPDSVAFGGSFTGENQFSGVISGAGNISSNGSGTWVLGGANTFTGTVTVTAGTLRAGSASAFGSANGLIVNGGTLDLGGYDLTAPSLTGTGGTVALGASTLTVEALNAQTYAGNIAGTGGLRKAGAGSLTLTGVNTYTGATTVAGGKLALDFSGAGGPASNILSASSTLVLSGGTLETLGAAGEVNNQSFNGVIVAAGSNTVRAINGAGGSANLNLGTITRSGGLVNFVLPGAGAISTSNADGLLGGWATINGSDYAKVVGGNILAFEETDYTTKDDAGTWANGDIISDTAGAANSPFFGVVAGNVQLGGLRYTAAAGATVTIGAGNTLGIDGTIIVAPSTLATGQAINGGFLTGSSGGGTLGVQHNGMGVLAIGSTIVDNGGATSFAKSGGGTVRLNAANSYTGGTTLSGGRLAVAQLANGGVASSIGASSADAANLVLESGTLAYTGSVDVVSDRGMTLVNGGAERAIEIESGRRVEFSGLVTSADDAGLTKTGWGTLVLSNAANDYVGVTTITQSPGAGNSTLSVNTLSNGGVASGIGAASSDSANLVISNGAKLQYTGGTVAIDRGFTLAAGQGGIDVAGAGTTLTIGGVATGAGSLFKDGAGTLVLSGTNTYTGDTTVNAGVLRAGSAQAFGAGGRFITVNSGATLDLGGFDIRAAAVVGDGLIDLGGRTLTTGDGSGIFTGRITGTGGYTRVGDWTQTFSGCNNDYTGVTTIGGAVSIGCIANGGQASGIGASSSASSNLVFANGTLVYTGASTATDRGFAMAGNGNLNVFNAGTTLEFSGDITGTGQINKEGAGTLLLSGSNNTTGNMRVINGTVRAGSTTALRSGWVSLNDTAGVSLDLDGHDNSVLYLIGGGTTGGNVTLDTATLTITNGGSAAAVFGGAISGSGGLIKNGGGYQQLSGCSSSYGGTTVINDGTLAVDCLVDGGANSSIGSSSSAAGNLVLNGGGLRYVGTGGSTNRQFTLGASAASRLESWGTGAIAFTHAGPLTFASANTAQTLTLGGANTANNILAAQITNNGTGVTRLTKTDTGTWILTNPDSSYTGVTTISGGVLGVDKLANGGVASSIGMSSAAASNLVIGNGSTLRYTGAGDATNRLFTLAAGVTFIESSGTGAVVFTDTGPVTLQGNNAARTIALGGTNTGNNTLAGSIGDAGTGVTSLAKNDSGTWVLTGNHTYTGSTNINGGILSIGGGGTTGSITSAFVNNFGTLAFNRSDSLTYGGAIIGTGAVRQSGTGTTSLTGTNSYTGGTTINAGTLQLGNGGTTGSILGNVANDGVLAFNRSDLVTFGGLISGGGAVHNVGSGTTVLTGTNTYTGGTVINGGRIQISRDANLGAASGSININNAFLETTADISSSRDVVVSGIGSVITNAGTTFQLDGAVSGTGAFRKMLAGTLILTGNNSYTGGTAIVGGTLQLGDGGSSGSIIGDVLNDGSLVFNRSDNIGFAGRITGTGSVTQNGAGIVNLTADNSYGGATTLNAGTLLINGNQSAATGLTTVNSGATLGGNGTIGGDVFVADGGILAPGDSPGTLTIAGGLTLSGGSVLNYEFGEANVAGGALNDLVNVGGNLTLDGTINVSVSAGGSFGGGIYRVFNYGGTLTDNGLTLGTMPGGSSVTVQTSVAGQVNLVNSAGLSLSFWDGDAGGKFNDVVNGGNGTWHLDGADNNWTDAQGGVNAAYADGTYAIFAGLGGAVTVDNAGGAVTASGMQFASNGYVLSGDALTLVGPESTIRVGDGTAAGAGFTTTIGTELTGNTQLVKTDLGTLVLSGANTYTGGTAINGGTLQIAADSNLGDVAGSISFNGGTLRVTTDFTSNRYVTLTGTGRIETAAGADWTLAGDVTGAGGLTVDTANTVTLTGDAAHTGGTTVTGTGSLLIGNNGTTGSIAGDIVNNAAVRFQRADAYTYAGGISGTGAVTQSGAGSTIFLGNSTYTGATSVNAGSLLLQSGGRINGTSGLTVNGGGQMIVDGTGSALITGTGVSVIGATANSSGTLIVRNGATASLGRLETSNGLNNNSRVDVVGAGSQLTTTGTTYFGRLGLATVNILAGGRMATADALVGGQMSQSGATATVSGAGSEWDVAGAFTFRRGTVNVANGGAVVANSAVVGFWGAGLNAPSADMIVTGAGSRFETNGAFAITNSLSATARGTLTIADGGVVRVGGGTLAMGIGDARLNIGGAGNVPASVRAGTLDAAEVTFAAANNHVNFNHVDTDYTFAARMSGAGYVVSSGTGTTILTGDNAYSGPTHINAGTLIINGDQSAATGNVNVNAAGTLGGRGVIGGDVLASGRIAPGDVGSAPGMLTINGRLDLLGGANLDFDFGRANIVGGPLNDLIEVGGDLVLDGTLNVQTSAGGTFDAGVYRVISYGGALTNNGLDLGTVPSANFYVQTSVPGQVNLVNTAGMTLRYWDGDAVSGRNNSLIDGGNGVWQNLTGNDSWTEETGAANAPFADNAFAVFMGAAGTVTVDDSLGGINVSGMQFLTDGYAIEGDPIALVGSQTTIRVGDGTAAGAGITASIASELTGATQLVKADLGTLILSGNNSYTGGTAINGGVLQIASDSNLGDAAAGLTFNGGTLQTTVDLDTGRAAELVGSGTVRTRAGITLGLTGTVSGAGSLTKDGAGIVVLTGTNTYTGGTTVNAGALFVNGDQSAATGATSVSFGAVLAGTGVIGGDVSLADGATLDPGGVDGLPGTLTIGGSLALASGSTLSMQFGEANAVGGALNDLIEVGGDLVLDGILDVSAPASGTFGPGIYRVINYGGTLTNNGLSLGMMPVGSTSTVQTSIAGQVNLVNTDGLALNFWDGGAGPKFNDAIDGGDGVWQNGTGNDNWTDASGTVNAAYADGAYAIFAGTGGTVTIDNSLGAVSASGMQIAADGYTFEGEALTLEGPQSTIRVGDGSTAGAAFSATIAAELTGNTQVVKTDAGTLVLSGSNSYTGGTAIEGGTLAIAADANLGDAAGGLTFAGGTLQTTADLGSDRALSFTGNGTLLTDAGTTFSLGGALSGTGALTKSGAGTLVLNGNNSGYTAATTVAGGTLAVDGMLGSAVAVSSGGRLEGIGQVGSVTNSGIVGPGRGIGTLVVGGNYVGSGGTLEIEAVMGGDGSAADMLVVNGTTSGDTQVTVINRGGLGGQTVEGIKIIDVTGASNGTFALDGDYLFQGEQAVIAGAYSYRLYQGGVATPADGDWYLRSSLTDPVDPGAPAAPIYQPGVPVYENYAQTLLALNSLPTLQQRVGNRSWAALPVEDGIAVWGRSEASRKRSNAALSTSAANSRINSWQLQMGADATLAERDDGATLIGGITAHFGEADSRVRSMFGNGGVDTQGYGLGATLTWYGPHGFYVDGQAQLSWFTTDLRSDVLGSLASNIDGKGEAVSVEVGKRTSVGNSLTLTPQAQMVYSHVGFDRFLDPAGAAVSAPRSDSLKSRWGLSIDHQTRAESATSGKMRSSHVYGVVNLNYEWLEGVETDVSGTPIANRDHRLWGELGFGGSFSWDDRITVFAEATGETAMRDFGDSYSLRGTAGIRINF